MKKFLALLTAALFVLGAVGCSGGTSSSAPSSETASTPELTEVLTVAASPAPHAEILEFVKSMLAEKGIDLQISEFTDYVIPNNVVFAGDIDANYFQHQPYLTQFNEENNTDLISVAAIHFEPMGIYPGKTATLEELAEGAVIGVPNDVTNEARALSLLAAQGIITLREGAGLTATKNDIIENPKNVVIEELAAEQLPSLLADFDFAVINGNYAVPAGIIDTVLVTEDAASEAAQTFANIVAVSPKNADDPRIAALVEALTSEETAAFIKEKYGAAVIPVF